MVTRKHPMKRLSTALYESQELVFVSLVHGLAVTGFLVFLASA